MRKINLNNFKVASSETVRDINRRIVLNLVRKHQPVSRASLARRSGLQRSTVSAITEQLISERWVIEGAVGSLPRGRKPTFLHLNAERAGIFGVDVRLGTTTVAVAGMDGHFLAHESISTGREPQEFLSRLSRRICDLMRAHPRSSYEGVGISIPGRVDPVTRRLVFAPKFRWAGIDIQGELEKATGLPVEIENTANACALAEIWSGRHGEAVSSLMAVNVSDELGVGIVVNGQLVQGSTGMAGEFGHVPLVPKGGPLCHCGNRGCWEMLASNAATESYYAHSHASKKCGVGSKSDMATLGFEDILRLCEQNDAQAGQALDQTAHYLGLGIAMLINGIAPDVVVVVGEITRLWDRVSPIIFACIDQHTVRPMATRIVPADPSGQARLRGTITLVLQKHFGVPALS